MKRIIIFLMIVLLVNVVLAQNSTPQDSFNVQISVPTEYEMIHPGEDLLVTMKLINLGSDRRADVVLDFWIVDSKKKTIFKKQETVAIETQASIVRKFDIPEDSSLGHYTIYAKVIYEEGKESFASHGFMVEKTGINKIKYSGAVFLIFLVFLLFFIFGSKPTLKKQLIKRKVRKIVANRMKKF